MKRIIILLALLALPFIAFAQTDDAAPKDDRPSVTRGAEEVKYMGSVNGGLALLGFSCILHTESYFQTAICTREAVCNISGYMETIV